MAGKDSHTGVFIGGSREKKGNHAKMVVFLLPCHCLISFQDTQCLTVPVL